MPAAPTTKDDILELERSYWEGMKAKDGNATAKLSGDPSLVSGSHGVMRISREKMGEMTKSGDWQLLSYEFETVEFSAPTSDVAILAYTVRQKVMMKGEEKEFTAADLSTWVRTSEGWTCHAHSETIIGAR